MTINYPNGTTLEALLLMHGNDTLRASVPGETDVRTFSLSRGTWISEECEPVNIEFAWQRREQVQVPNETDCVCPMDLASRLIAALHAGTRGDRLIEKHVVCVFGC